MGPTTTLVGRHHSPQAGITHLAKLTVPRKTWLACGRANDGPGACLIHDDRLHLEAKPKLSASKVSSLEPIRAGDAHHADNSILTDRHVQSVASREAVLRSERLRILIVLSSARSSRVGGCTSYPAAAIDLGWRLTFWRKQVHLWSLLEGLSIDRPSSFLPGIVAGMVADEIRTRRSGTAQGRDAT